MELYNPDYNLWRIEYHTPDSDAVNAIVTINPELFLSLVGITVEQELELFTDKKTGLVPLDRIPVKLLDSDINYIVLVYQG